MSCWPDSTLALVLLRPSIRSSGLSKFNSFPPNWKCLKSYLQQVRYWWLRTVPWNLWVLTVALRKWPLSLVHVSISLCFWHETAAAAGGWKTNPTFVYFCPMSPPHPYFLLSFILCFLSSPLTVLSVPESISQQGFTDGETAKWLLFQLHLAAPSITFRLLAQIHSHHLMAAADWTGKNQTRLIQFLLEYSLKWHKDIVWRG